MVGDPAVTEMPIPVVMEMFPVDDTVAVALMHRQRPVPLPDNAPVLVKLPVEFQSTPLPELVILTAVPPELLIVQTPEPDPYTQYPAALAVTVPLIVTFAPVPTISIPLVDVPL